VLNDNVLAWLSVWSEVQKASLESVMCSLIQWERKTANTMKRLKVPVVCILMHVFCRYACIQNNQMGYKEDIVKKIVGCVVLTKYNNCTYRVDDITFDKTPTDTFEMMDGSKVSFIDYYRYGSFQVMVSWWYAVMLVKLWHVCSTCACIMQFTL